MTQPEDDPLGRSQKLENIVDDLGDKVAEEREADGVPGRPSERENTVFGGPREEPPD